MNLQETLQALENKNIQVAIDLGVHGYCELQSNCPLAIQLRKYIQESGITAEQLFEGFSSGIPTEVPVTPNFGDIPVLANLTITIAGQHVRMDLSDQAIPQLRSWLDNIARYAGGLREGLTSSGSSYFRSYLHAIREVRKTPSLTLPKFPLNIALESGVITTQEEGRYAFTFPVVYNPQYAIREGIRYSLSSRHIEVLKRKAYLTMIYTPAKTVYIIKLLKEDSGKLQHYHGNIGQDCWGNIRHPNWNGTLIQLVNYKKLLMGSLVTVNMDSLLNRNPVGMPSSEELRTQWTVLGREGELTSTNLDNTTLDNTTLDNTTRIATRTGWGRRG